MHDMAESSPQHRMRPRRTILIITLAVLGCAATSASAATVTAPTLSGPTPQSTLTASTGAWTPASATPSYDWLRCNASGTGCAGISNACGRLYFIQAADQAHTLRVRLTVTESNGEADSAVSNAIAISPYVFPSDRDNTCTKVTPTGPGKGTFTSGAQTGAGTTPSPNTSLPFIDPFPVVRIAGRFKGKRTTLRQVAVRAPRGTRIQVRCTGRGCPYRRRAVAVRLIRLRALQATYRPRATIEIRVTEAEKIGKYTRVTTRRGKAPVRIDRCLMPGSTRPVKCPTA
jgi:hypothetical protein